MFVLDASGSVGNINFGEVITFVVNVVNGFSIGPNKTEVGVIRFSSNVLTVIPLGSNNNQMSLINSIKNIIYTGGFTNTHLALRETITVFSNRRENREKVPQVAIVLTDGHSSSFSQTMAEAVKVREEGIQVFSIGVGDNVNELELVKISYDPTTTDIPQNQYVFHIDDFQQSSFAEILLLLQVRSCSGK